MISDLQPGQLFNVHVIALSGDRFTHPTEGPVVSCLISSEFSNILSVTPVAPPEAVRLKLVGVSTDGLDLTWPFPQQYGEAFVSVIYF